MQIAKRCTQTFHGQLGQMNKRTTTFIKIDNWGEINREILIDTVKIFKGKGTWDFKKWKPTPALIEKNGKTSQQYVGQNFDQKHFDMVVDGWSHDHCEFCTKTISDDNDSLTTGYNLDNEWICEGCYNLFMQTDNLERDLEKYQRVEK